MTSAQLGSYLALEPVGSLTTLIHHLTSTPVHPDYFPYLRFPVIHAVRVAIVWASLTRGRNDGRTANATSRSRVGVGLLGDLFGYLCLAWGGSTFVALLQSTPPPWLISTAPWIIYPFVHLVLVQTGLARLLGRIPLVDLLGAYIDGLTRGTTLAAISSLPNLNISARALLGIVGTCGGGWVVQSLSMHKAQWAIATPAVLQPGAGVLGTMDAWAPALCSIVYSYLTDPAPALSTPLSVFGFYLDLKLNDTSRPVDTATARSVVVSLMASLLAGRVITRYVLSSRLEQGQRGKVKTSTSTSAEEAEKELLEMDEKTNTRVDGSSTPKKKKTGRKSNSGSSGTSSRAATPQR